MQWLWLRSTFSDHVKRGRRLLFSPAVRIIQVYLKKKSKQDRSGERIEPIMGKAGQIKRHLLGFLY